MVQNLGGEWNPYKNVLFSFSCGSDSRSLLLLMCVLFFYALYGLFFFCSLRFRCMPFLSGDISWPEIKGFSASSLIKKKAASELTSPINQKEEKKRKKKKCNTIFVRKKGEKNGKTSFLESPFHMLVLSLFICFPGVFLLLLFFWRGIFHSEVLQPYSHLHFRERQR